MRRPYFVPLPLGSNTGHGVKQRAGFLFPESSVERPRRQGAGVAQLSLFDGLAIGVADQGRRSTKAGSTVLDRLHQAMLLFGSGDSEALAEFLQTTSGVVDARFWHLAQSLSALYPMTSDEKRWVDGVLTRKKSFGY